MSRAPSPTALQHRPSTVHASVHPSCNPKADNTPAGGYLANMAKRPTTQETPNRRSNDDRRRPNSPKDSPVRERRADKLENARAEGDQLALTEGDLTTDHLKITGAGSSARRVSLFHPESGSFVEELDPLEVPDFSENTFAKFTFEQQHGPRPRSGAQARLAAKELDALLRPGATPETVLPGSRLGACRLALPPRPSLRLAKPMGWEAPQEVLMQADAFDEEHKRVSNRGTCSLRMLSANLSSEHRAGQFNATVFEIRKLRYGVQPLRMRALLSPRERGPLLTRPAPSERLAVASPRTGGPWRSAVAAPQLEERRVVQDTRREWRLEESTWGKRSKFAASKAYLDTEEVVTRSMEITWGVARGRLGTYLTRRHGASEQDLFDTCQVVVRNGRIFHSVFDYYAGYSSASTDDVFQIKQNAFRSFLAESGLIDLGESKEFFDQLFQQVNASLCSTELRPSGVTDDHFNAARALNKQEVCCRPRTPAVNLQLRPLGATHSHRVSILPARSSSRFWCTPRACCASLLPRRTPGWRPPCR